MAAQLTQGYNPSAASGKGKLSASNNNSVLPCSQWRGQHQWSGVRVPAQQPFPE